MQKLLPGFNDPDWSDQIKCYRAFDGVFKGCGATFLVTRSDLYISAIREPLAPQIEHACFCCFVCDTETRVGAATEFRDLPTREQWFEENRPKDGFVIELDGPTYFAEAKLARVVKTRDGWLRATLEEAPRFPNRELAEAMLEKWKLLNSYTQVHHFHPKIVRTSQAAAAGAR